MIAIVLGLCLLAGAYAEEVKPKEEVPLVWDHSGQYRQYLPTPVETVPVVGGVWDPSGQYRVLPTVMPLARSIAVDGMKVDEKAIEKLPMTQYIIDRSLIPTFAHPRFGFPWPAKWDPSGQYKIVLAK